MPTEGATVIAELNPLLPTNDQDTAGEGDDHIRQEKFVLTNQFQGSADYEGAPDAWDIPLLVGPRELNAMRSRFESIEGNYLTTDTVQTVLVEHTFAVGLKLASDANITGRNAADTADRNLIGILDDGGSSYGIVGDVDLAGLRIFEKNGNPKCIDFNGNESTMLTSRNVADIVYPVGSVLFSADNVNPGTRFANTTWSQIATGRFVVGVGQGTDAVGLARTYPAGNDGVGEYKHQLTIPELARHDHAVPAGANQVSEGTGAPNAVGTDSTVSLPTGNDTPHENSPPGFGMYIWQRTA